VRRLLVLAVAAVLLAAPAARADGDPASDYLLGQSLFVPPDDNVPQAYQDQLQSAITAAKARGYVIRVALIGTRYDMGSVSVLYRKPQQYARFLGKELAFVYKGRLLVVMPNGLAVSKGGNAAPAEQRVVAGIRPPGTDGSAMAAAATTAVSRLAGVPAPPLGHVAGSSTGRDRIVIAAAAIVAAALVAGVLFLLRRRKPA
jgi:hypothetical protein